MAPKLKLIIGNKNYSSWSLRPWIVLKYFKIPFQEVLIPLYAGTYKQKVSKYSPSGKVPALIHDKIQVWDSLAICEYLSELYPKKHLWPQTKSTRAHARSISQEMHAGFAQLRTHMPMNLRAMHPGKGRTLEVEAEITRIIAIWNECRKAFKKKGPFLFGTFSIADAMYLPVVTRFRTYGVATNKVISEYMHTMLHLPAFKEWEAAGAKEPWRIEASEL